MKTAQQLQQENDDLKAEIKNKNFQIELRDSKLKQNKFLISNLQAQLFSLKKHRFGSSSEKDKNQLPLFNEAEQLTDAKPKVKPKGKRKKAGKRKALPEAIEREEEVYDITDDQKHCPKDGTELKQNQKGQTPFKE